MSVVVVPARAGHPEYPNTVDTETLDTGLNSEMTVTRFIYPTGTHLVAIDDHTRPGRQFILTQDQAAELAEVLKKVSGMASAPSTAIFLADTVRESLERKRIRPTKAARLAGLTRYRMRRLLDATVPMTLDELKAISEIRP